MNIGALYDHLRLLAGLAGVLPEFDYLSHTEKTQVRASAVGGSAAIQQCMLQLVDSYKRKNIKAEGLNPSIYCRESHIG